jgi:pimeloyl-ACP methyl ester carboxylesterase
VTEPQWLDVTTPTVQVRALTWGPADGPIALCLHGFPDTAYTWRKVAPQLVDAGWRVVAPFMRGYAPTSVPSDGSYHVGALMDDALRVLDAAGPTGRDVFIGHDWGALAGAGLAAMPDSPPSICTAQTTAAPRTTRRGLSGCYPMKASSRSSKTPDTSCSSISDVVARHIVDFVGQAS